MPPTENLAEAYLQPACDGRGRAHAAAAFRRPRPQPPPGPGEAYRCLPLRHGVRKAPNPPSGLTWPEGPRGKCDFGFHAASLLCYGSASGTAKHREDPGAFWSGRAEIRRRAVRARPIIKHADPSRLPTSPQALKVAGRTGGRVGVLSHAVGVRSWAPGLFRKPEVRVAAWLTLCRCLV